MERIRYETPPEDRFEPYDHVGAWSGAVAGGVMGALGGLALVAFPMFVNYVTNNGAFTPLRIIGTIGNARHTDVGTATVIFGLFVLLAATATIGASFGALANRQGRTGGSLPFGVGYSFLWLLMMTFGILPMLHRNLFEAVKAMPIAWIGGTFVFGLFIGMAPIMAYWGRARWGARYVERADERPLAYDDSGVVLKPPLSERWRGFRARHAR